MRPLEIAQPRAHNVTGEAFAKLRLSSGSQVVEESRPRLHARSPDDSLHLRAEVCLAPANVDDVVGARIRLLECSQEIRAEFGEQRQKPAATAIIVGCEPSAPEPWSSCGLTSPALVYALRTGGPFFPAVRYRVHTLAIRTRARRSLEHALDGGL